MASFSNGDEVEVTLEEEGFYGSYYQATVKYKVSRNVYRVEFKHLMKEDESGPLADLVSCSFMRPIPPPSSVPPGGYSINDRVEVLDKDGWWVGRVVNSKHPKYRIRFDINGHKKTCLQHQIRDHFNWIQGQWVSTNDRSCVLNPKKELLASVESEAEMEEEEPCGRGCVEEGYVEILDLTRGFEEMDAKTMKRVLARVYATADRFASRS